MKDEIRIEKTRGPMYVLSPFLLYLAGVVVIEVGLALLFMLFSLIAHRLGTPALLSINGFLHENEALIIPTFAGLVKIPHFLKDFYHEDWAYRVEKEKALSGEYVFNAGEAELWKHKGGIRKSIKGLGMPAVIVLLSLSAGVFFDLLVSNLMGLFHLAYSNLDLVSDVGGVGGPGSAIPFTGGETATSTVNFFVLVLSTVVIAPVVEELVFRGVIFQRMRDNHGFLISAAVSAAAFGIVHFNLMQGLFGFCMGMVFAFIYDRYHRLTASIAAHMAVNIFNVILMIPGIAEINAGLAHNRPLLFGILALAGIVGALLIMFIRNRIPELEYVPYSHVMPSEEGGEDL